MSWIQNTFRGLLFKDVALDLTIQVIKNFIAAAHDGVVHALYSEGENDLYLAVCKELNGKPVAEVKRRGVKLNKIMDCSKEEKQEDFDEDIQEGQLLMF